MGSRRHDVAVRGKAMRGPLLASLMCALLFALPLALPAAASGKEVGKESGVSATPNRYGAIAYDRASRSWGVGYNYKRARDASVEALNRCGHGQCEVIHKFKNGCAALADGPKIQATASGATRDEAETKTLKQCGKLNRGASCDLIGWGCTR